MNVTGNGWTLPIDEAVFILKLPGEGDNILETAVYTGKLGEKGRDAITLLDENNNCTFFTTRRLRPGEGLTVAVAWKKGLVVQLRKFDIFQP